MPRLRQCLGSGNASAPTWGAVVSGGRQDDGHDDSCCTDRGCRRLRAGGRGRGEGRGRLLRGRYLAAGRRHLRPAGAWHRRVGGRASRPGAPGLADGEGRGRRRRGRCAAHRGDAEPGQRVLRGGVHRVGGVPRPACRPRGGSVERGGEAGRSRGRRPLHPWPPHTADHPGGRDGRGGRLARDQHHRGPARDPVGTGERGGAWRSPHDDGPVRARQRGPHRARRATLRQPPQRGRGHTTRQGTRLHGAHDVLRLRPAAPARHRHRPRGAAARPRPQRSDGPGRRPRGEHHRLDRGPRQSGPQQ